MGKNSPSKKLRKKITNRKAIYIWLRDGGKCIYCAKNLTKYLDLQLFAEQAHIITFDHILPVSQGGKNDVDNLGLCCEPCNTKKGGKLKKLVPLFVRKNQTLALQGAKQLAYVEILNELKLLWVLKGSKDLQEAHNKLTKIFIKQKSSSSTN